LIKKRFISVVLNR